MSLTADGGDLSAGIQRHFLVRWGRHKMAITITFGATVQKDPEAELLYVWPWGDSEALADGVEIADSEFLVSATDGDAAPLEADSASVTEDGQSTQVRLTGGTIGAIYTVTNRIVTNGSPAETDDRSIKVKIAAQ